MPKIEKLTAAQIARVPEFVERWTKIGLSTAPADKQSAEAAIAEMYKIAGLAVPKIVWCGSPLSQGLTRAIILDKKVRASVRASVWDSVWDSVRASVGDSVWDSVWASVRASVGASVRDSVRASVWDSVGDSVWDSVGASVWDSVRASVGDSVWDSVYGQHDAGWLAFYDYFKQVTGLTVETARLSGLLQLAKSAGWALPHKSICWVSERHNILARDDRGRLHSLSGPACAYPDGWAIYAVHGVRVPEYVIERPKEITVAKIDAEQNAESRRVMIERYRAGEEIFGAGAFIRDGKAKRLDHDERWGTLWQREVGSDEPILMNEVVNRSPEPDGRFRHYFLRVPPSIKTAHEAVAWSFGKDAKDYMPAIES